MELKQKVIITGGFWTSSILLTFVYQGLIGVTNPFRYWLAFIEFIEFLIFIPSNLDMLSLLFTYPMSSEVVLIWIGLPAFLGWLAGMITALQAGRSIRHIAAAVAIFLFNPVLSLLGIWYIYKIQESEKADLNDPAGKPIADGGNE